MTSPSRPSGRLARPTDSIAQLPPHLRGTTWPVRSAAPPRRPAATLAIVTVVKTDLPGLIRTHESLMVQSCRDYVWIVVDGGGCTETRQWLQDHRYQIGRCWSGPDGGPYDAMNRGARAAATSPYILFLNAGDRLPTSDTLASIIAVLKAETPDFLYGASWEDRPDAGPMLKPARSHRAAWYGMFTHHQAMVYRTALLPLVPFDPAFPIGADYALTVRILRLATRIKRLAQPLAWVAPPGLSARYPAVGRADQAVIRRRLLGWPRIATAALSLLHAVLFEVRRLLPILFRLVRCENARTAASPICSMENVALPQRQDVADEHGHQLTFGI